MLISALVAFGFTLAISPLALVGLRRLGVLDVPSERSSHGLPTPRGGGIAVGIGAVTALLTGTSITGRPRTAVLVAACGFGLVGLIDDVRSQPAIRRLAFQLVTASLSAVCLLPTSGRPAILQVGVISLTIFWLVSYVNAFNFMDGINGISVAQVVVAGGAWVAIAEVRDIPMLATAGVVLAAAALGFAPFNFPSARMFLGDAGSYFIGAWLAAVTVLLVRAGVPPEAALAPLSLYLADTGATLCRRIRGGQTWYIAHRDHTYQQLIDRGWSHKITTLVVGLFLVVLSGFGLLSLSDSTALRVTGDFLVVGVLAVYLVSPEWLA